MGALIVTLSGEHENEPGEFSEQVGGADQVEAATEISRRDALRKAAIGFGVAGAAWVAPKIEGLSMEPDYAAAGTAVGQFTITRSQTPCPGFNNCWGACNCNPATTNHTIGGEPISVTWAGKADISGNGSATVDFSNMDPPFNSNCRVTGAEGDVTCCVGDFRQNSVTPTVVNWDINNVIASTAQGNDVTITIVC